MFTILLMLPFIEAWITGDKREHHLLQRPRNAPTRTAVMVALMTFYGLLWAAGGNDIIAITLRREHQPDHVLHAGRGVHRSGDRVPDHPALVHLAAAARPRDAAARLRDRHHHAVRRGRLLRAAPAAQRRSGRTPSPRATATTCTRCDSETDANGVAAPGSRCQRLRARLSTLWYADNVQKPTREELEEGHHHAEHEHELQSGLDHPADGHQFDGHHLVEEEHLRSH